MAVLRIDRFVINPRDTAELINRRNALVAAVRDAVPGLLESRLVKVDESHWIDMWRVGHAGERPSCRLARPGRRIPAGGGGVRTGPRCGD